MCRAVLLHGLMGSGACWTPVVEALDFEALAPDARGHGDSRLSLLSYRYEDLASDAEDLLRTLDRPVLVGHSMGGMTAALVASRNGALLRGLVLVDPTFLSPERQREVYESDVAAQHRKMLATSREELVADMRKRHSHRSDALIDAQVDARLRTHLAAFDILKPPNPDYRALVRSFDVPTLLVIGDAPVVTMEMAEELRVLNPRLQIAQIENAGHGLPFDQPLRLAETIRAFVTAVHR